MDVVKTELITFSLGSNFDTTKVTNMSGMFQNFAHKLGILNLGTQFYTSEVTDMSNMFNGCGQNAMTTLTLGTNFDTTKVTNMSQMFKDFAKSSTGMTSLDLGDSFYTTSITDMTRMFNGCGQTAMVASRFGSSIYKNSICKYRFCNKLRCFWNCNLCT
ncbi:MAG: BspA family leucine-rich repeat surface protein [Clostridia bacterium]